MDLVAFVPVRTIIARYPSPRLSLGGLERHKDHIRDIIRERQAGERSEHAGDLLVRIESVISGAQEIMSDARASKNLTAAVAALNATTRALDLLARATGQLVPQNSPFHLTLNRTNTTINVGADDLEFAQMIGEATHGFSIDELMRLKGITEAQIEP
jgi:hypothetical protein